MIKHIFIVNPYSSNYDSRINALIADACESINIDCMVLEVENEEETINVANRFKNKDCILYAVGGDGTVNYILNLIVGGKAKLGIIPMGSGNDFYRSLDRYYSDFINTNVMKVNDRYGLNIFSVGIDGEVCKNSLLMKKWGIPSSLIYKASLIYTFFNYKNKVMGLNNHFEKRLLIALCNGSFYGGGFEIAPNVNITSPNLKVCTVGDLNDVNKIKFIINLLRGTHEHLDSVDVYYAKKSIHIESLWELVGQLDGEVMISNEFDINPCASNIGVVNNRKLIRELSKK